jgi:hypothetical protein
VIPWNPLVARFEIVRLPADLRSANDLVKRLGHMTEAASPLWSAQAMMLPPIITLLSRTPFASVDC